jgi:hypothetical protein
VPDLQAIGIARVWHLVAALKGHDLLGQEACVAASDVSANPEHLDIYRVKLISPTKLF